VNHQNDELFAQIECLREAARIMEEWGDALSSDTHDDEDVAHQVKRYKFAAMMNKDLADTFEMSLNGSEAEEDPDVVDCGIFGKFPRPKEIADPRGQVIEFKKRASK
jgi:hypothetical protein